MALLSLKKKEKNMALLSFKVHSFSCAEGITTLLSLKVHYFSFCVWGGRKSFPCRWSLWRVCGVYTKAEKGLMAPRIALCLHVSEVDVMSCKKKTSYVESPKNPPSFKVQ